MRSLCSLEPPEFIQGELQFDRFNQFGDEEASGIVLLRLIDYILDLIEKYRNSCQDKNLYSKLISSIGASPTLRLKRELIEKFVAQLREEDSVDGQFSSFVEAEALGEAQEIAEEGGLDPARLKRFINRSFKNGQLSTDGTSIVKLAKGQIGFGLKRKQWKMETVKVLTDYFEKYVDLIDAI